MSPRRYAEGTEVPVEKSQYEIVQLLRQWGAHETAWGENTRTGQLVLSFKWDHECTTYAARFSVKLPTDEDLQKLARHAQTREYLPSKFKRLQANRGRQEMRLLLLWLKATFNAVEAGIIEPTAVFLPWILAEDGRTVHETMAPMLPAYVGSGGRLELPAPRSR